MSRLSLFLNNIPRLVLIVLSCLLLFSGSFSTAFAREKSQQELTAGDQFLLAVAANNRGMAQRYLQMGVPIDYTSTNRDVIKQVSVRADKVKQFMAGNQRYQYASGTAYDIALANAQAGMVRWLLRRGADPAKNYFKQEIERTYFANNYPPSYLNLPYKERARIVSVGKVLSLAVADNDAARVAQLLSIEPRAIHYRGNNLLPDILRLGKWRIANLFLSRGKDLDQLARLEDTLAYPLKSEPTNYAILQGLLNHARKRKNLRYQPLLLKAMKKHDAKALKMLVQAGASLNPKHEKPLLFIAAEQKDMKMVALLLKLGADPDQKYVLDSLLHKAVSDDNLPLAQTLLDGGADVNIKDYNKQTPIQVAIHKEKPDMAILLLNHHADVRVLSNYSKDSLLHIAVREKKPLLVTYLINAGAPVNAKNKAKETPLLMAVRDGKLGMTRELLRAGANPNIKDRYNQTPLQMALSKKNIAFSEALINARANVNEADSSGNTPLILAAEQVNIPLMKMLLKAGAKPNYERRYGLRTALHVAIDKADLNMMRMLLNAHADVNIRGNSRQTALHLAVNKKHLGMVNLLLKYHPQLNVLDSFGNSPLHTAVLSRNLPVVRRLLEAGAEPNTVNNSGETPLTDALSWRKAQIAKLLIDKGAKVNVLNNRQQSPYDIARTRGLLGIANYLRRKGARTAVEIGATRALKVKIIK